MMTANTPTALPGLLSSALVVPGAPVPVAGSGGFVLPDMAGRQADAGSPLPIAAPLPGVAMPMVDAGLYAGSAQAPARAAVPAIFVLDPAQAVQTATALPPILPAPQNAPLTEAPLPDIIYEDDATAPVPSPKPDAAPPAMAEPARCVVRFDRPHQGRVTPPPTGDVSPPIAPAKADGTALDDDAPAAARDLPALDPQAPTPDQPQAAEPAAERPVIAPPPMNVPLPVETSSPVIIPAAAVAARPKAVPLGGVNPAGARQVSPPDRPAIDPDPGAPPASTPPMATRDTPIPTAPPQDGGAPPAASQVEARDTPASITPAPQDGGTTAAASQVETRTMPASMRRASQAGTAATSARPDADPAAPAGLAAVMAATSYPSGAGAAPRFDRVSSPSTASPTPSSVGREAAAPPLPVAARTPAVAAGPLTMLASAVPAVAAMPFRDLVTRRIATADAPLTEARSTASPDEAPAIAPVTIPMRAVAAPLAGPAPASVVFGAAMAAAREQDRRAATDPVAPTGEPAPASGIASATAPVTATLPLPARLDPAPLDTRDARWPQAMVSRIEALRDSADAGDTRIRLLPDALGTIDVALRRDGEVVHVHFTAEDARTATLIAEAQPRLADAAEQRGLRLGQTSVDAVPAGQTAAQSQPSPPPSQNATASSASGQGAQSPLGQQPREQQRQPTPEQRRPAPAPPPRARASADDADDARIA